MADDILLKILLDKAAQSGVERGIDSISKKIEGLDDQELNDLLDQFDQVIDKVDEANKRFAESKKQIEELNRIAGKIGQVGTALAGVGASIVGAYTLSAKGYIDYIEKAGIKNDQVANRWIAATGRIKNAQLNLGASAAQALLPYLEKAASLVEKIAAAAAQNPEAVRAVLGAGVAASVLGALALAVSKGIKIYSDVAYMAALANHSAAMREFVGSQALGGAKGGGAGIGGTVLKSAGLVAIGTAIALAITTAIGNALAKTDLGKSIDEAQKKIADTGRAYPGVNVYARETKKADDAAQDAAGSLRDFAAEEEAAAAAAERAAQSQQRYASALQVVSGLAQANAQAQQRFQSDIASLYSSAGSSYAAAGSKLRSSLANIDTELKTNLAKLGADFAKESLKAEEDYQEQRQKTIQDANDNVRKIQEDAQEQLAQLAQDHNDRMYDLAIARDALGIIQENRRYEREKSEIHQQTQKQVAETRRQTQIQLAEQRKAFNQQQAERQKEYAEQVKEEKLQAEIKRKEAQIAHDEEIRQIGIQTAQRAAEIRRAYYEERRQRIEAANAQLQDLGYNLQSERQLRMMYYQGMLSDANSFMAAYKQALTAGTSRTISGTTGSAGTSNYYRIPLKQAGGYGPGLVERGDEFVLNPRTTRAAESMIGAKLTQQNIMNAMGGSITLNDQRRFYGGITPGERRAIDESTREQLAYLVGG